MNIKVKMGRKIYELKQDEVVAGNGYAYWFENIKEFNGWHITNVSITNKFINEVKKLGALVEGKTDSRGITTYTLDISKMKSMEVV